MVSSSKSKSTSLKDFEKFELDAISILSNVMSNFNWEPTKLTRDGNKDATSLFESEYFESAFVAWLEVKYRSNPNANINSRAFDSTLVSAIDEKDLRAMYLVTNARVNALVQYRVTSFVERVIPRLQAIKLYDGESLFNLSKAKPNSFNIDDFVSLEVNIVSCIDYSNFKLYDAKAIAAAEFNYIVVSFFNPFPVHTIEPNEKPILSILKGGVKVIEHQVEDGWNYSNFIFTPTEAEIEQDLIKVEVSYKEQLKIIEKKVNIYQLSKVKVVYHSSLKLSSKIQEKYNSILKRHASRVLALISGAAGCGKTYLLESICANWSKSHEITHVRFSGLPSDWERLSEILSFSFDYNQSTEVGKAKLDPNSNVQSIVEQVLKYQRFNYRKVILIDDWHKASPDVILKSLEVLSHVSSYSNSVSLFLFSRPCYSFEELKSCLQGFESYDLQGPTFEDTRDTMKLTFNRSVSQEEVKLVFELSPNLISLINTLDIISERINGENSTSVHSIINEISQEDLFELPPLDKSELELIAMVYFLPNGLKDEDLTEKDREVIFRLTKNGLVKSEISSSLCYIPIHDLWRDAVISKYTLISGNVINRLKDLSKRAKDYYYAYLSAIISKSTSLVSKELSDAREIRDKEISRTNFGAIQYLSEAIINTCFHSQVSTDRLTTTHEAMIVAYDLFQAGNVANHTSYHKAAVTYLNKALSITRGFLHDNTILELSFRIQAELINLQYWSLDCSFLDTLELPRVSKQESNSNRTLATSIMLNRKMMAHYLMDNIEEARKTKSIASRFCTKYNQEAEKIHLIMDSAKNELIYSPKKALRQYTIAINKYKNKGGEMRRVLIATYQRDSLKVKLGENKMSSLLSSSEKLRSSGFSQEYMNSMIDIATIYAVNKEIMKANSCLNQVSAHPDFYYKPRLIFKINQCKAIISLNKGAKEESKCYWEKVLSSLSKVGSTYKSIPIHNIKQNQANSIIWKFGTQDFLSNNIYLDPRLW